MTISAQYAALNREIHESDETWGTTGQRFAQVAALLYGQYKCKDALDYGCGKQTLRKAVPHLNFKGYDPAIPEVSRKPKPRDLVTCTDVLEHIEPQFVEDVILDLKRVTKKVGFFVVSTVPAIKKLPDGRNAHLSVHPAEWWLMKILPHFKLRHFEYRGGEFDIVVEPE